ncbi:MAG: AAA family ATPase [Pirellulaceae bacterium]|nr:AAA family ATPase [Pirellulaceae bacterium]
MYEEYWRLQARPFENRIGHEQYYPAESHQAALLKLRYAIENRRAAALLCGPSGMGKSLIADMLLRQLDDTFRPLQHVVFPTLESSQLLRYLVQQVDTQNSEWPRETSADLVRFERLLVNNIQAGRHGVIVVDEAHLLEQHGLLEPLRLLLNVAANQSPGESAWTLVLVGQPIVLSHVERYQPLDERLAVKCMLNRLLPEETVGYIQHRLRAVGGDSQRVFNEAALERIHQLAHGIPRKINRLCDLALMVGYAEECPIISADVVASVHNDLVTPVVG